MTPVLSLRVLTLGTWIPARLQLPERILLSLSGLHDGLESPRPWEGMKIKANLFTHLWLGFNSPVETLPSLALSSFSVFSCVKSVGLLSRVVPRPLSVFIQGDPIQALHQGPLVRQMLAEDHFETSSSTLWPWCSYSTKEVGEGHPGSAISLSQTLRVSFCPFHVCPGLSGLFLKTYSTSCLYHSFGRLIMTV